MSLSDRDRKLLMVIVPLVALAAYWFVVLAPKRAEATRLSDQLAQAEQKRDSAVAKADQLENAKSSFADDLASIIRVGKAVPSSVDMPSLLVQLDEAARGTDIRFERARTGQRSASAPVAGAPGAPAGGSTPGGKAAPGGAPAGSAPGKAAEKAGEAKQTSEAGTATAGGQGGSASGSPAGAAPAAGASAVPGLDTVPLEFTFRGSFFDLADLFHRMKRFVRVKGERVSVHGRLMTVDGVTLSTSDFPRIKAEVKATVYLAPTSEGASAGASPAGPAPSTPAGGTAPPAGAPASSTTPTATAPAP